MKATNELVNAHVSFIVFVYSDVRVKNQPYLRFLYEQLMR